MSLGPLVQKVMKCSKNDGDVSKAHIGHVEEGPTGQISEHFEGKINDGSNE